MDINKHDTAMVVIDPQNDYQSEKGVALFWVSGSVTENNTIENI